MLCVQRQKKIKKEDGSTEEKSRRRSMFDSILAVVRGKGMESEKRTRPWIQ